MHKLISTIDFEKKEIKIELFSKGCTIKLGKQQNESAMVPNHHREPIHIQQ